LTEKALASLVMWCEAPLSRYQRGSCIVEGAPRMEGVLSPSSVFKNYEVLTKMED